MMIARALLLLCIAALCLPVAAESEDVVTGTTVIATVGGAPITAEAVQREMARSGGHDPARFDELDEKRAALDAVVRAELLAQAAIDAGFDQRPEIQDEIKRLLAQRYWAEQKRSQAPPRASDAEIEAYYEAHPKEFVKRKQYRGSIVFLRASADAGDTGRQALREEAESLSREVASGRATLAAIAHRRSDDRPSRQRGGDIGWFTLGQRAQRWPQIVLDATAALETPGAAPMVVETERGVYLVQLTDRRGGGIAPFDEVRRQIALTIVSEKQQARAEAELAELSGRYPLEVDEAQLRTLLPVGLTAGNGPPSFPVGREGAGQ